MAVEEKKLTTAPRSNTYQSNRPTINPEQVREDLLQMREDDYFTAQGGKRAASARIVRFLALQEKVNSEILDFGKTKEKAWARVKAWIGPKEKPDIVREDAVCILFDTLRHDLIFSAVDKGKTVYKNGQRSTLMPKWKRGADGIPILDEEDPTSQQVLLMIDREYIEKVKYAERSAVTSAERRAFLKVLGHEDEDDDKIISAVKAKEEPVQQGEDITSFVSDIRNKILQLVGGDKQKAGMMFKEIAEMIHSEGIYPKVTTSSEIKTVGHVKRILEMVEEIKNTPVEVDVVEEEEKKGENRSQSEVY